jgi:hypothetical protein
MRASSKGVERLKRFKARRIFPLDHTDQAGRGPGVAFAHPPREENGIVHTA